MRDRQKTKGAGIIISHAYASSGEVKPFLLSAFQSALQYCSSLPHPLGSQRSLPLSLIKSPGVAGQKRGSGRGRVV